MSVTAYIEKLQKKPERAKYKILFLCVFLIMAVIIVLWLTVMFFPSIAQKSEKVSSFGPFSAIKDDLKQMYEAIKK